MSLHLQHCPAWVPQFIERSGVEWIKWVDPPEQEAFRLLAATADGDSGDFATIQATLETIQLATAETVKVIGRTYEPDGVSNDRVWQGANGAQGWFNHWLPFYASRPWVHCWEGPNEPQPMADHAFRACLNEFTVELARLMHNAGLRLVGMNWGVGWPDVGHAPEMGEGVQACDYLGLHEYCAPAMWDGDGWYTLRYRRTVAELEAAGFTVPPIIVGECGIDGGVLDPPHPKTGWKTWTRPRPHEPIAPDNQPDFDRYLQQLKWYSQELDRDNVTTATIFTVCSWDWADFRIDEPQAMPLADWIASDQDDDDDDDGNGEDPIMDVKVFDKDGGERDWAWVQATYGNVEIRQPTDEQLVDAKGVFRIIELREVEGSLDLNCHVQGVDQNDQVAFYWPDAPVLEQYDPPTARWEDQAFKANIILGTSTLLMGGQSDYNPETQQGAYGIWPLKPWMASEYVKGLGWLMATQYRHLDVTFKLETIDDPEPLPEGDLTEVVEQLTRIADAAEAFVGYVTR